MNRKEYTLPNGKKAVFEYDITGVGKITLECMDELMGMIANRPQGEWIPCSERLPNYREVVLVSTFWGVRIAERDSIKEDGTDDFWYLFLNDATAHPRYVYAWMPLPEPWKGKTMSKYIKLEDIETLITACEWRMTLAKERHVEGFVDYSKQVLDVDELTKRLSNLSTIEVSEEVEDERCKGCKHYKLACDLFSEICKYEPITQTETQNSNLTFEIADTPKAKVSEDAISRADAIKAFTLNSKGERIPFVDCDNFPVEFPLRYIVDTLAALPPADKPQGEWIAKDGVFYCSRCDNDSGLSEEDVDLYEMSLPNYCQDCGAKMKGADDDTD